MQIRFAFAASFMALVSAGMVGSLCPANAATAVDATKKPKPGDKAKPASKTDTKKADTKKPDEKNKADTSGKPGFVGQYGDWKTFVTQGVKNKTCYALAQPKERQPSALKRDPAYIFISTRQAENVKNEVSIIMGFGVKEGATTSAEIDSESFELLGKGTNAWVKNPAEEPKFVATLRKGSKLVVKMPSVKGNVTTDNYSLSGLSQALDRAAKECL